ncbi:MAG: MBOAT family protein, partial [Magnetospirillum sp.]|nr:MBOAT family protein [Magnetospirillum sp.]
MVFLLFTLLCKSGRVQLAIAFLCLSSLVFYAWENPRFLPIILASISANFLVGSAISHRAPGSSGRRYLLILGVGGNLAALGWFKYSGFLAANLSLLLDHPLANPAVTLPLGISFYTFTQIAYLVDAARGETKEYNFLKYLFFVTWFPHLIAGPILHHREIIPQLGRQNIYRFSSHRLAIGATILAIGLFKKTVIADRLSVWAGAVFDGGASVGLLEGWVAALAYTLQIYFDFSAYSDMAIGISFMFGIRLPINFFSPYKATSITDFWRRWHISLSRFLRDYLYISLGGNRRGAWLRYRNLLLTMVLGGLWHGAAWTFVVWGALHGLYLVVNHAFRAAVRGAWTKTIPARLAAWGLTFLAVVVAWVFFRAPTVDRALEVLAAMSGLHGVAVPERFVPLANAVFGPFGIGVVGKVFMLPGTAGDAITQIGLALAIALLAPNCHQLMRRYRVGLDVYGQLQAPVTPVPTRWTLLWRPRPAWAIAMAVAAVIAIESIRKDVAFLY